MQVLRRNFEGTCINQYTNDKISSMTCIWHILPISKVLRRLINHNLLHIAEFQRLLPVNNNPGGGGKLPVTGLINSPLSNEIFQP